MARLYKFCELQHRDSFFRTGRLRLGTIHDFRDTINHDAARGDEHEGRREVVRHVEHLRVLPGLNDEVVRDVFSSATAGAEFNGVTFHSTAQSPDGYVFCTSAAFTEELFLRWHAADPRTDACYVIDDPLGFASAIQKAISHSISRFLGTVVSYRTPPFDWRDPAAKQHPAFVKHARYEWQREHRIVFVPKMPPLPVNLNPWLVDVPEAIRFCRPFATIEGGRVHLDRPGPESKRP